jgi:large-conductance mechanosensitive channel
MWTEFKTFLVKDNIIGLAIAVILGLALNKLGQHLGVSRLPGAIHGLHRARQPGPG